MKRTFLLLSVLAINFSILAQANPAYVIRIDSLPIKSFDLSSKGVLNIQQTRKTSYGKVEVIMMRGKRPVNIFNFSSVTELNQSDLNQRVRAIAQPGDRLLFELVPAKGSALILNLPIK